MKFKRIILLNLFTISIFSNVSATILDTINKVDLNKLDISNLITFKNGFKQTKEQRIISDKIIKQLNIHHYLRQDIDLDFGNKFLKIFIEELDGQKLIFLENDIKDIFKEYGNKENNPITSRNLEKAYEIYYFYLIRKAESIQVKLKYIKSLKKEPNLNTDIKLYYEQKEHLDLFNRNKILKETALDDLLNIKIDNILSHEKSKILPIVDKDEKGSKEDIEKIKLVHLKDFTELKAELVDKYEKELKRISNNDVQDAFMAYVSSLSHSGDIRTYWNGPKRDPKVYDGLMGISFDYTSGDLKVISVSGAAKEVNIKPGDIVVGIANNDPKDIKNFSNYSNYKRYSYDIAGKAGEKTYVYVQRDSKKLVFELIRKRASNSNNDTVNVINYNGKNGKYASVSSSVNKFYLDFGRDIRDALDNRDYDGVIIDLRNNGGGLVHASRQLASAFLPMGTNIAIRKYGNDKYAQVFYTKTLLPQVFDGALFLLQNSKSASASEATAAWFDSLKRGYILGGKSFGKGTTQSDVSIGLSWYSNSLHRTVGKFYAPSGNGGQLKPYEPIIYFAQNKGNPYKDYEINNVNPAPGGSIKSYKDFKPFAQYVTNDITKKLINKSEILKAESIEYIALEAYVNELKKGWVDYKEINLKKRLEHYKKLYELHLNRANIQRKLENKPLYKNYYEIPSSFVVKDIELELSFKLLDYYAGLLKQNKK